MALCKFASSSIYFLTLSRLMHARTWNCSTFNIYHIWHILAKFHSPKCLCLKLMVILGSSEMDQKFLVKTHEIGICYKIKSLASFSLIHNDDGNMLKKWNLKLRPPTKIKSRISPISQWPRDLMITSHSKPFVRHPIKFQVLTPQKEIPISPDFSDHGPKFSDRDFIMMFPIIYLLKFFYLGFL